LLLATLLALCVAAGARVLLVAPAEERLSSAQAVYEEARKTQARLEAARRSEEELAKIWGTLPARKEFAMLSLAISELARHDQVSVPGMSYTFQKVEDGLAIKASMKFRAAGEYAAIRRFIHRLETTGPYLFVESLDATRSARVRDTDRGSTGQEVVFNVSVVTFLRPDIPDTKGKA
jgi:hypothetical protein